MYLRCKNAIKAIRLPDRTKIFLSSIWVWVYLMFYFTKFINVVLGLILVYTPDSLIIFNPFSIMNTSSNSINKPIILDAYIKTKSETKLASKAETETKPDYNVTHENTIDKTEHITNKIRALINSKWDIDVGNDNCPFDENNKFKELFGGLNIREIVKIYPIISTSIVWIAYLFETDKKLNNLSDDELGKKIKYMLINFGDNILYRNSKLQNPEDIIVGDIPF